jgi:hypothetical protein
VFEFVEKGVFPETGRRAICTKSHFSITRTDGRLAGSTAAINRSSLSSVKACSTQARPASLARQLPPTVTANTVGQLDAVTEFGQSAHTNQRIARTFDDGPDRVSQPSLSVLIRDNEICGWLEGCVHAVQAESHDLRVPKEAEGCFLVPGLKRL